MSEFRARTATPDPEAFEAAPLPARSVDDSGGEGRALAGSGRNRGEARSA
jgi:hypothetical protein